MNPALPPGDRGDGGPTPWWASDIQGLCLALVDWSAELRLPLASQGLATVAMFGPGWLLSARLGVCGPTSP